MHGIATQSSFSGLLYKHHRLLPLGSITEDSNAPKPSLEAIADFMA
jgi:hypothetical protein